MSQTIDASIKHTSDEVESLDPNSYYTLAWKNLGKMQSLFEETEFNQPQLCQKDKNGALVKEPHGDGCSKPNGLYLAPGRSWIDFAYDTKRWQFYKRYLYKVTFESHDVKLYDLSSHEKAIAFAEIYGNKEDGIINSIRWNEVASIYNGTAVLNWELSDNPNLQWYNTFEASQLVIWKALEDELHFELIADTTKNDKIFKSPVPSKGGRKYRKTRSKRKKFTNIKKGTKKSTSRKARYSRKKWCSRN